MMMAKRHQALIEFEVSGNVLLYCQTISFVLLEKQPIRMLYSIYTCFDLTILKYEWNSMLKCFMIVRQLQGAHWVLKLGVQCRWMGYNCCFFLNFVPLHIESPYNFGGTWPILVFKKPSAEGKWACWACSKVYRIQPYEIMFVLVSVLHYDDYFLQELRFVLQILFACL